MVNICLKLKNNKLFWITIIIFIFAFLLFRPYALQSGRLFYGGDDEMYFAHATSLIFLEFPEYNKEYWTGPGPYPMASIGPALMALPFVFTFSLIDRIADNEIIRERNSESIGNSWALFGFVISTIFYFYLGILLLYLGLSYFFNNRISFLTILFMILFQYFPLYAFRRPVFSHIYEFFLQSALIFIFLKLYKEKFSIISFKITILIGVLIGLIPLVRYGNIFIAITWQIIFYIAYKKFTNKKWLKGLIIVTAIAIALIALFKIYPTIYYGYEAYSDNIKNYLLTIKSPLFYLKRMFHIFFWMDWGLIYTAPFLVISLCAVFFIRKEIGFYIKLMLIPIIFNLYGTIMWGTQGGWYGYRYIVFSLIPILIFPFAYFLNNIFTHKKYKLYIILLSLIAIFPILSMLLFEGNNTNLTLKIIKQYFEITDWGNNFYQVEIYKTLIQNPIGFFISIFKGGPLYLIYLTAQIFHLNKFLPFIVLEKYPVFNIRILIKTIIIYIFPFVLYFLYILITQLKNKKLSKKI